MIIKVVIADDHPVVRDGLKSVIERTATDIRVVGVAADGNDALELVERVLPDVCVFDIGMPRLNGIEAAGRLCAANRDAKVIILSMHDTRSFVERAFVAGVKGYLVKDTATEDIVRAIREVYAGRCYVSPAVSQYLVTGLLQAVSESERGGGRDGLTSREKEVLQLVAEGRTVKGVARELSISVGTAQVHRKSIMRKLDIHTQAELVRYALREGFAEL